MKKLLIIFIVIPTLSLAEKADTHATRIYDLCESEDRFSNQICETYLNAIFATVSYYAKVVKETDKDTEFEFPCLPNKFPDSTQLRLMYVNFVEKEPEILQYDAVAVMDFMLIKKYRCN